MLIVLLILGVVLIGLWILYLIHAAGKIDKKIKLNTSRIEIVVTNGEAYIEGLIRSLNGRLRWFPSVSLHVICVSCTDQTVEIVKRLYELQPSFDFFVQDVQEAYALLPESAASGGDVEPVCRVDLRSGLKPKDAVQLVENWLNRIEKDLK